MIFVRTHPLRIRALVYADEMAALGPSRNICPTVTELVSSMAWILTESVVIVLSAKMFWLQFCSSVDSLSEAP